MSRRNKNRTVRNVVQKGYSLSELDRLAQEIEIRKTLELEKAFSSNDPSAILAASAYLEKQKQGKQGSLKSYFFDPDIVSLDTNGYRTPTKGVSFDTLKRMSKNPVIRTIINTRTDQVASFAEPVDNEQEKGWMIRRKKRVFDDKDAELSDADKSIIEKITEFILKGGSLDNKWEFEGLEEYIRSLVNDSLVLDQVCWENVYTRGGELCQFYPVDAATIRLVDTSDTYRLAQYAKPSHGYWPKYCQIWQENICAFYYPWEMTFGVRNKTTDIRANGYGLSELEDMVNIVTYLLFGIQYNGNFFSQGSNPKGFFKIKGNVSPSALNDFKQMWRNTITGVWNSHRVPVLETGGVDADWVNMMSSNKDMEFQQWMEFLITIACCMFRIDPTECGFTLQKGAQIFGQDGQKERLKHSQSKGLVPLLKLFQRMFTKYIVEPIDDKYEFVFCGVETEDQVTALDMDVKKVQNGFMSMEDGFKKWSGRDFDPENDTVLNNVYLQMKQAEQMGGDMMNGYADDEGAGEMNPFEKSLIDYLNK